MLSGDFNIYALNLSMYGRVLLGFADAGEAKDLLRKAREAMKAKTLPEL